MYYALLLTIVGVLVQETPITDHRYEIEYNHVSGRFTQMIIRNRYGEIDDWHVIAENTKIFPSFPNVVHFVDNSHKERYIKFDRISETWTDYDPEVLDRKYRNESYRYKLEDSGKGLPYRPKFNK